MQASLGSRDELTVTVQRALSLSTKKEAAHRAIAFEKPLKAEQCFGLKDT
jgi:hypothetical protein